jgi:lipoprotein-anchoring transpeptidase ErfK/SrfK
VLSILSRLGAVVLLMLLAACGGPREPAEPPVVAGYEGVQDGDFFIPPVEARFLTEGVARAEVDYAGDEDPGTIVLDTHARRIYYVMEGGRAWRYTVGIGQEGTSLRTGGTIGRKAEWPSWTPTANMIRRYPELYGPLAGGRAGGLESPLGARALYLYRGGRDTMYRIHGTIDDASIGRASSAGCVRLFNQDIIHLHDLVERGARLKVRSLEESLALEGPWMDDANGNAVPETPENIARKEKILAERAESAARIAAEEVILLPADGAAAPG